MSGREEIPIPPLARELNATLEEHAPEVVAVLSPLGRRLYFPKGILSQGAEAKARAHRVNATIGIATEGKEPMHLASIRRLVPELSAAEIFDYAPPAGRPRLRELWRDKQLAENPAQRGRAVGLPIVTSALTHGLSIVGDLFVGAGDRVLIPDQLWGNYRLTYGVRLGAEIATFPFYSGQGFACDAFARALAESAAGRDKLVVLLNFPNNPTGYMPTEAEGEAIVRALVAQAERGTRLVVVTDDAYFGLFYHLDGESMVESLFGRLANRHPNLLAVKLDGATKEFFVWGLRCGFLTFGPGRSQGAESVFAALEAKVKGAIRGAVSNASQLSQSLVERALQSPTLAAERRAKCEILQARAERVHAVANAPRFRESWSVYPFNSGYFMCLAIRGVEAERLRVHLLDLHGAGLVSTSGTDLRIAFSCLELDEIEPLFETIHRGITELARQG
jgi:aspartate/methionine/tyrosine aminotransferase